MVADLERFGKRHAVITGVVESGDPAVQAEMEAWCRAAQTRRKFRDTFRGYKYENPLHLRRAGIRYPLERMRPDTSFRSRSGQTY